MQKTASQLASYVLSKCAELSEQDRANLEYINSAVDQPFDKATYPRLGGIFGAGGLAGGAAAGAAGGLGLRGSLLTGGVGGAAGLAGGLGLAGLLHYLTEQNRPKMREQREEILSRAPEGYEG